MEDYIINVKNIEEMQMINDVKGLDSIFQRAKVILVGGGTVAVVRHQRDGQVDRIEEFTNLDDLATYLKRVYKYINR
ncbi:hypothetical protein [Paraflavitalea sp. CAU 1676]|uniref:hypothetical protein n=1 Tax=Paraflavitalea sp. CAU 1676 TaxID=3032598 RepID=UPI0023DCB53F|nr:hypothetical protein [Paraflavitalea sp. CAU 1676]MDF2189599.1 hypothetical protein [Paraflavitalea sp. CAU 1676]